jgi:hypothetical protein
MGVHLAYVWPASRTCFILLFQGEYYPSVVDCCERSTTPVLPQISTENEFVIRKALG